MNTMCMNRKNLCTEHLGLVNLLTLTCVELVDLGRAHAQIAAVPGQPHQHTKHWTRRVLYDF